ncbi:mechanosensitive ion channel-like protein [Pontibacter ummariensis]|uniref:Mechanosensitive ion channel n=1 Tax=Pontibacter ummariensis TaxID=1610492 RepID=A0A239CHR0_9BACT|nr:mechanosensitive ion channel family protein [Pontibacter ummariensis]PRY15006.1 mechanosensitive ion channel-like protein [Pontibacter ummariensis]SNS19660.1 Mechanosensitive ion channel [Pontibacter ummariensis]
MRTLQFFACILSFFIVGTLAAQPGPVAKESSIGAPVVLHQDTLFHIYNSVGSFTKEERASAISKRVLALSKERFFRTDSVRVRTSALSTDIVYMDRVLMSVSETDATAAEKPQEELAEVYAAQIRESVRKTVEQYSLRSIMIEVGLALLVLVVFFFLIRYVNKLFQFIFQKVEEQQDKTLKGLKVKEYQMLTPEREVAVVLAVGRFIRLITIFILIYILLPILFSIFPWTESYADTLLLYILSPLRKIGLGIINYVPNLLTILVIVVVTHYVVKFLHFLTGEVEEGKLEIPGFYAEWAKPTYNIIRFLLYAFMFVVIFPYLPGSDSPIFQGVSVFIGILFSLGSSSAIANIVAGMVLTYMRSFKVGDRIKIGEVTGDVVEKTLLVTRVRTTKNEDITIPNAMILNNHTTNFTTCCSTEQKGLLLHTTVTIGYDVPWPKVHQALIDAALATPMVEKEPSPFVLQTSLDDFYVSYQLNAYTMNASKMAAIYSGIHQNIQDKFNEAGIEILSPHYRAQRDGNMVTIPEKYLPQDYQAPSFRVEQVQQQTPPVVHQN